MKSQGNIWNIVFRVFTFVIMVLMVIVVIRLTPFPDLDAPEEPCDRPCHELEWPRICRLRFILESYNAPRRNCNNYSDYCFKDEFDEDTESKLLTVNRQIPGPAVHVCLHDIIVVDVVNRIPDRSVAIHWRGQIQKNTPLMDGVPMVTQCPIVSHTTFQYKFRASTTGTHLWHLYNDEPNFNANNVYGMLVVRESVRKEVHSKLADYDESSHVIALRGVKNSRYSAIFVNGKRPTNKVDSEPWISFNVTENKRYRFRVAHGGGNVKCPISGSVDGHKLIIIALDGNPIEPVYTTQFTIVSGERLDFILWANQFMGQYDLKFSFADECDTRSISSAKIVYEKQKSPRETKTVDHKLKLQLVPKFSTVFESNCGQGVACLENVKSLSVLENILNQKPDHVFYLSYGYQSVPVENFKGNFDVPHINNITFLYPSSPFVSQITDIPMDVICNEYKIPNTCSQEEEQSCHCTHVIDVELGKVVELVLVHQEKDHSSRDHVFHLHGHKFYVLSRQNTFSEKGINEIKKADAERNFIPRNLEKSAIKDTISVPRNGLAVIRFLANSAGHWLFREEGSHGMELVFNIVGSLHDIPDNFPRCGNYVGPKYFLE